MKNCQFLIAYIEYNLRSLKIKIWNLRPEDIKKINHWNEKIERNLKRSIIFIN